MKYFSRNLKIVSMQAKLKQSGVTTAIMVIPLRLIKTLISSSLCQHLRVYT